MTSNSSQFAARLQAKRRVRNLSQQDVAGILSVSPITVFRWEDGTSFPDGKHIPTLIEHLDFSRDELELLYEQFLLSKSGSGKRYQIAGYEFAYQAFPTWEKFLDELIALDYQEMDIEPDEEGTSEHWAPIFEKNSATWKLVVWQEKIVGYWHYMALSEDAFCRARNGKFYETKVTPLDYEFLAVEGDYRMFISQIVLDSAHREASAQVALRKSFVNQIRELSTLGIFFEGICAYACTDDGARVCDLLGMEPLPNVTSPEGDNIFYISGERVSRDGLLSRDKQISRSYKERYSK